MLPSRECLAGRPGLPCKSKYPTTAVASDGRRILHMTEPNPLKPLILLVDDSPAILHALIAGLRGEYRIKTATAGQAALEIARHPDPPELILLDVMMPGMSGIEVLRQLRLHPQTRDIPVIFVSADNSEQSQLDGLELGADDYLTKPVVSTVLQLRVRNLLRRKHAEQSLNVAYRELARSQRILAKELVEAANYVRSLLPRPIYAGPVRADWRFIPSTHLGGDSFGYHWLDGEHFALYLLDVSGHGVGSSLMSVSALDILRSQALPNTDFRDPSQVLRGLNTAFDSAQHDDKYFTIWYGVYNRLSNRLTYGGGGHPPALLFNGPRRETAPLHRLSSQGTLIGVMPEAVFTCDSIDIQPGASLFLFGDGVFEITQDDGNIWEFEEFVEFMVHAPETASVLEQLTGHVQTLRGSNQLDDDFSIIEFRWQAEGSACDPQPSLAATPHEQRAGLKP